MNQQANIRAALQTLLTDDREFFIINAGDYYVQFLAQPNGGIYMEAVSEYYLVMRYDVYRNQFIEIGFNRHEEENYSRIFSANELDHVVELVYDIMHRIYKVPEQKGFELNLAD